MPHDDKNDDTDTATPPDAAQIEEAAATLSSAGASKGGKARAKKLSREDRSQIALAGAAARWHKKPLAVICGSEDRPLRLAGMEIPAYVLEDGVRVLSQRGLQGGIGLSLSGGSKPGEQRMASLVSALEAKGVDTKDLAARIKKPILFSPPGGGRAAFGYEATLLADLCDVILEARREGKLQKQQEHVAAQCEILVRGFARVGIIALVDEATGYQDLRARDALADILEAFIADELRKWVRTFPADFYKEIFRLNGWQYPKISSSKRPSVIGHWTNDLIYDRLAPGVRDELHRLTPRDEKGRLKNKLFQYLSEDVGHPKLREHLSIVVALMRACDDWPEFKQKIDRALPRWGDTYLLPAKLPNRPPKKKAARPAASEPELPS